MGFFRKLGLNVAAGLLLVCAAGSAVAQTDLARQTAETFIDEMIVTARSQDRSQMEAFLRDRIDTDYAFDVAFAPVTGVVSPGQRERLANLMLRFTAGEAIFLAQYAQSGELRFDGSTRTDAGTMVEATYRDAAGEYPFNVLVGRDLVGGRLLIRDMGSPRVNSVVTKLTAATTSLAQATPDANVWITAFERALAE